MNDEHHIHAVAWHFLRTHYVRAAIGVVLAMAVFGALSVWMLYQREQQIAREIESLGGSVTFNYCGPSWIPQGLQNELSVCDRIVTVDCWKEETDPSITDEQLKCIEGLVSLQKLNLGRQLLLTDAGLWHFMGLCNLEALDLNGTSVAKLAPLGGLTRLKSLRLDGTPATDAGLSSLKRLTNLKELSLGSTGITDAGLDCLSGLTRLHSLHVDNTSVSDAGLSHLRELTDLEQLDLSNTRVSDGGLQHLSRMTKLRWLFLDQTPITDAGLKYLSEEVPNLIGLRLSGTGIGDAGLAHLAPMKSLRFLNLEGTVVTDAGLAHLVDLPNLESLNLCHTGITRIGFAHLRHLASLSSLTICGTHGSCTELVQVDGLTNLKVLWLYDDQITAEDHELVRKTFPHCNVVTEPRKAATND